MSEPPRSDRHTVTLDSATATITHPAPCTGTCPYTTAAEHLPPYVRAITGTWTVGLADDGTLIVLARLA